MSVWIHRKVKTYTLDRIKSPVDLNVHLLKEESPKDYTTTSSEKKLMVARRWEFDINDDDLVTEYSSMI